MPVYYTQRGRAGGSPHVFIAIPSYGGMCAELVHSLWGAHHALTAANMSASLEILAGGCHVDDARNNLVRSFLESDATEFVFIDADVGFEPADLVKLVLHDADIVAGIYPLKQDKEGYPVRPLYPLQARNGLVEVEGAPTGFLRIRRHVLEKLAEGAHKYYGRADEAGKREPIPLIFERTFENGQRVGGDYSFCIKARRAGFSVWVDPEMHFRHVGEHTWKGHLGDFWKQQHGVWEMHAREALETLRAGGEVTDYDIKALRKWWGNEEWSASPELLRACIAEARGKDVAEFGSGLSTVVLEAVAKHVSALEHDLLWWMRVTERLQGSSVVLTDLDDDGYDCAGDEPADRMEVLLVDGPPRNLSTRRCALKYPAEVAIFDDAADPEIRHLVKNYAAAWGGDIEWHDDVPKPFAIVRTP